MAYRLLCITGPDFVAYDPPVHDCKRRDETPHWVAEAWFSRGAAQRKCADCGYYYFTPTTKEGQR